MQNIFLAQCSMLSGQVLPALLSLVKFWSDTNFTFNCLGTLELIFCQFFPIFFVSLLIRNPWKRPKFLYTKTILVKKSDRYKNHFCFKKMIVTRVRIVHN